jgi:hypothetical protein
MPDRSYAEFLAEFYQWVSQSLNVPLHLLQENPMPEIHKHDRVRIYTMEKRDLLAMFAAFREQGYYLQCPRFTALPPDYEVLDVHFNFRRQAFELLVASETFPERVPGDEVMVVGPAGEVVAKCFTEVQHPLFRYEFKPEESKEATRLLESSEIAPLAPVVHELSQGDEFELSKNEFVTPLPLHINELKERLRDPLDQDAYGEYQKRMGRRGNQPITDHGPQTTDEQPEKKTIQSLNLSEISVVARPGPLAPGEIGVSIPNSPLPVQLTYSPNGVVFTLPQVEDSAPAQESWRDRPPLL